MSSAKLSFKVPEDAGAPVGVEHLHCELNGTVARIESAPFFVPGLVAGDEILPALDEDGVVVSWQLLKAGEASTVWLMNLNNLDLTGLLAELREQGCLHEGLPALRIISVIVPLSVTAEAFDGMLAHYSEDELPRAYPCWRHGED